jgi:hypothetical protein
MLPVVSFGGARLLSQASATIIAGQGRDFEFEPDIGRCPSLP